MQHLYNTRSVWEIFHNENIWGEEIFNGNVYVFNLSKSYVGSAKSLFCSPKVNSFRCHCYHAVPTTLPVGMAHSGLLYAL